MAPPVEPKSLAWSPSSSLSSLLRDLPIVFAALALLFSFLSLARYWASPVTAQAPIQLNPGALPRYALFSLARIIIAYAFSLMLTLVYAYVAAHNARAERFLIPLLDTLQSIPVLSFLPPVMVSMVALFPTRQLGVELGCILLILTGQVWNMTFSVYASMKSIPREMAEAAQTYRLSWWQRFIQLELPYSAIGLVWNSMMSVAGGWFFLMACEMFVLENHDLRLPGLGSYLQTAANAGDTRAILWGVVVMVAVIVLMDQVVWRPIIAWSEKFKFEQVEASQTPHSPVLDLLRRSRILSRTVRATVAPARETLTLYFGRQHASSRGGRGWTKWIARLLSVAALLGVLYAIAKMTGMLAMLSRPELTRNRRDPPARLIFQSASSFWAPFWKLNVS